MDVKKIIFALFIIFLASTAATAMGFRPKYIINLLFSNSEKDETRQAYRTEVTADEHGIVWKADHETGDLSQWAEWEGRQTSFDSGICKRPKSGVSTEYAHSGTYSMKMSIDSSWKPLNPKKGTRSGCREFRRKEAYNGKTYYYSAWYLLPEHYQVNNWAMLGQFKSKKKDESQSDPIWSYRLENNENGRMRIALRWKAAMDGPGKDDLSKFGPDGLNKHTFRQDIKGVTPGEWFHIEVLFKQSSDYTGTITVWQDGVEIFDKQNVKTQYPDSTSSWSVTSYGYDINPEWFTVYVDDAVISTKRIGNTLKL